VGQVNRVADGGELAAVLAADVAHRGDATVDADAVASTGSRVHKRVARPGECGGDLQGSADRVPLVGGAGIELRVEQGHDLGAHEFVNHAAEAVDRLAAEGNVVVKLGHLLLGRQIGKHGAGRANLHIEHGDVAPDATQS